MLCYVVSSLYLSNRNVILCSIRNTKLPPALMGLRVGQQFDYHRRTQQNVTMGETIAAMGRQLLQMALDTRTHRLS